MSETYQEWSERMTRLRDCEICGGDAGEVHHIFPGTGNKARTRREVSCVLFVCRKCHNATDAMSQAKQLAYLLARRPWNYDLEKCHKLTGRAVPYADDVFREFEILRKENGR